MSDTTAQNVIFVGEREFIEIFSAFGLESKVVDSSKAAEEFIRAAAREYALICLSRKYSDIYYALSKEHHELNIFLLSAQGDKKTVMKDFKKISEQAAGVDLTSKL